MKLFRSKIALPLVAAMFIVGCAAQQPAKSIPSFTPAQFDSNRYVSSVDNFLIILDASSSMGDKYAGNKKYKIATEIVNRLNQTLPELGQNAGLRSFGHDAAVSKKSTVLFYGMERYSTEALKENLGLIKTPGGASPMHSALTQAGQDLKGVSGKTAVVIISDGQEAYSLEPSITLAAAEALKKDLGSGLCYYPVIVGDDEKGTDLMEKISKMGECGFGINGDKLLTSDGMAQFVKDVFLTERAITPIPPKEDEDVTDDQDYTQPTWVIDTAHFDFDKAVVKPSAYDFLDKIAEYLNNNPEMFVNINGHTDSIGSKAYNDVLSLKRAEAVKSYIVDKGIDENRLSCQGFAFSKPVSSNKTTEGRALNRRVEIYRVK